MVPGPVIELAAPHTQLRLGDNVTVGRGGCRWGQPKVDRQQRLKEQAPMLAPSQWPPVAERAHRKVNANGDLSFAGAVYNVGRAWAGQVVEVFSLRRNLFLYIAAGESVIKRHPAKHSAAKVRAALGQKGSGKISEPRSENLPRTHCHRHKHEGLGHSAVTVTRSGSAGRQGGARSRRARR